MADHTDFAGHSTFNTGGSVGSTIVIRARFRMATPGETWVSEVSTSFPDATLRLLTGVPRNDRALELGEVRADDPGTITEALRRHPDISEYEQLYADDQRAIATYEATERGLYDCLWTSSLPPAFPIIVKDGQIEFSLTATRKQFEAFGSVLDATGHEYDLLALVHTDEDNRLLTDRQRECLTVAQRQGYFEVPRDCTLTELADTLGIDKSTASETVRRGTARVMSQFLVSHG